MPNIDLLIVGAGPVGCVVAETAARERGWTSLIIDKRAHVAGNCYDSIHKGSGLLVHNYGPHYFRTNSPALVTYLSRFTDWVPGNYFVKSYVKGRLYPFPINLTTLEQFFGTDFTATTAQHFLDKNRMKIRRPKNSEEFVLSRVGQLLYKAFYLGYTLKQWGRHPRALDASVCGRIPIRLNRDERYVDHRFQLTPAKGFTALFKKMIAHPKISVVLETDFKRIRQTVKPRLATVYCGPVDEYFNFRLGLLPWRSLRFSWRTKAKEYSQPCVQINYPNDYAYTRSVEIKHITGQKSSNTVVAFEYPEARGEPFYPIPSSGSKSLYESYRRLAEHETTHRRVYFAGRLAQYQYINTDQALEIGMATVERMMRELRPYG